MVNERPGIFMKKNACARIKALVNEYGIERESLLQLKKHLFIAEYG